MFHGGAGELPGGVRVPLRRLEFVGRCCGVCMYDVHARRMAMKRKGDEDDDEERMKKRGEGRERESKGERQQLYRRRRRIEQGKRRERMKEMCRWR